MLFMQHASRESHSGPKHNFSLKLMGLPLNPEATALWRKHFTKETHLWGYDDDVVGPAMVIQKNALNTWAN